jgi:hypothetical protein
MPSKPLIKRQTYRLPHKVGTMGAKSESLADAGRWWKIEGDAGAAAARQWIDCIYTTHGQRHLMDALFTGLYEGQPPYWLGAMAPRSPLLVQSSLTMDSYTKARANLIRRCIDTAASMLSKNPADIRVETDGASWKLQKKARQRTKFVNGILHECGFHEVQQRTFIDACLARSGGLPKLWIDYTNKKIRCDRLHPSQLVWNDYEGERPFTLGAKYPLSKSYVAELYPDNAKKIEEAPIALRPVNQAYRRMFGVESLADQVNVYETWRLSGDEAKPGRHIVSLENVTLLDEEWEFDFFPIPRLCWSQADSGWSNSPLADQLVGYHIEIGKSMRKIRRSQDLACVPRVWIEQGSEVVEDELTNEIGGIGHYKGAAPQISPSSALPPEFYNYLDWLFKQAMADTGLNEMQSMGQKPMGLDSGKALREYNDTGATRQIIKGQAIERQTEVAGEIVFRLAGKLAEKCPDFAANALGAKSFEHIAWKDVAGDMNDIRFRSNPVSALSSTSAGRIQDVTDIIKGGLLPPEEVQGGLGLKLLNFPDLEKVVTMETASRELVEMQVDGALYEGEYFAPEPYQSGSGLTLLKTMAYRAYAQALQMDGVPARNLDLLRRLMSEADQLTQRLAGKAPQIQQPAAAVPAPAPAPLEQSPIAPPPIPGAS